jgi:hypothetical protein
MSETKAVEVKWDRIKRKSRTKRTLEGNSDVGRELSLNIYYKKLDAVVWNV